MVRPKILSTRPVTETLDLQCEIHVLTSSEDWLNLVWALKSFYYASKRHYALCIHDDGTLSEEQQKTIRFHFPAARLISRQQANREMEPFLESYPRCAEFRRTNHLAPKLFDFLFYLRSERMLLLDSDVLFFSEPSELLQRIEDRSYLKNSVNRDVASAYTVEPDAVRNQCGVYLVERFNSGVGLIHKSSLRLEWIEEFLKLPNVLRHFWRIEQTLFALCSSRYGVELLPAEYDVRLERGLTGLPCRHYVGAIRQLMYSEGIRALVNDGFLKDYRK